MEQYKDLLNFLMIMTCQALILVFICICCAVYLKKKKEEDDREHAEREKNMEEVYRQEPSSAPPKLRQTGSPDRLDIENNNPGKNSPLVIKKSTESPMVQVKNVELSKTPDAEGDSIEEIKGKIEKEQEIQRNLDL